MIFIIWKEKSIFEDHRTETALSRIYWLCISILQFSFQEMGVSICFEVFTAVIAQNVIFSMFTFTASVMAEIHKCLFICYEIPITCAHVLVM
jgi:hypothetical protein